MNAFMSLINPFDRGVRGFFAMMGVWGMILTFICVIVVINTPPYCTRELLDIAACAMGSSICFGIAAFPRSNRHVTD